MAYQLNNLETKQNQEAFIVLLRELALLFLELIQNRATENSDTHQENNFLSQTIEQLEIDENEKQKISEIAHIFFEKIQTQIYHMNFDYKSMLLQSFYIETKGIIEKNSIIPINIIPSIKPKTDIIKSIIKNLPQFMEIDKDSQKILWTLSPQKINQLVKDILRLGVIVETPEECQQIIKKFTKQREWQLVHKTIKRSTEKRKLPQWLILTFLDTLSDEYFEIEVMTLEMEKIKKFEQNAEKAITPKKNCSFLLQNISSLLLESGLNMETVRHLL